MFTSATLCLALAASTPSGADDWPQFRGPGGRCVAADERLPLPFGPDEGVRWRVDVPAGHSSPCVHGDLIVLTGSDGPTSDSVVAYDRATGKERWRCRFVREEHPSYLHADAGPALPTPCTDGERFVAYLGGYGLVALDREGELLWERRLPHPGYGFGVGPSPLIVGDLVVLPRDGAPEAALLSFALEDGEECWKVDRFDYGESHGTPFLWTHEGGDELIVAGTRRLCSFEPATGELIWTYDGITVFPCTTPTSDGDVLYFAAWSTSNSSGRGFWDAGFGRSLELSDAEIADVSLLFDRLDADRDGRVTRDEVPECRAKDAFVVVDRDGSGAWELEELTGADGGPPAPGKNVMLAIAPGGRGELGEEHVLWSHTRGLPYVASPLVHRGRVWLFKAGGLVSCLDAASGKPILGRERLSDHSEYYLSPVAVGDHVVAGSAEGTLYVLDADADELEVVQEVTFDEELFATPAMVDGVLYVRTKNTLWAFGR